MQCWIVCSKTQPLSPPNVGSLPQKTSISLSFSRACFKHCSYISQTSMDLYILFPFTLSAQRLKAPAAERQRRPLSPLVSICHSHASEPSSTFLMVCYGPVLFLGFLQLRLFQSKLAARTRLSRSLCQELLVSIPLSVANVQKQLS